VSDGKRWLADLSSVLSRSGLNHVGVLSARDWDEVARPETRTGAIAQGARSVVVVASGGAALWHALVADCRAHPGHFLATEHPLDAFVRRTVQAATTGQDHPWFYAAFDATLPLDFRTLAVMAGLGSPSRLGLVLDSKWGPWIGLRAAAFVPFELPSTPAAKDLCVGCPAPCLSVCPGQAFVDGRWSVSRCASFHQASDVCTESCVSREACPIGQAQIYPAMERLYHYKRSRGRAALRALLGIEPSQDPFAGSGPYWGAWSE
jgi:hypothetical protein